jgi:hypothetical protein
MTANRYFKDSSAALSTRWRSSSENPSYHFNILRPSLSPRSMPKPAFWPAPSPRKPALRPSRKAQSPLHSPPNQAVKSRGGSSPLIWITRVNRDNHLRPPGSLTTRGYGNQNSPFLSSDNPPPTNYLIGRRH